MTVSFQHNTENQTCVCTSEKLLSKVFIEKELGGYRFYKLRYETGKLPKELSGRYSSIPSAQQALENYLRGRPVSKSKRVKEYGDMREKERNAAKLKSKGS